MNIIIFVHTCKLYEESRAKLIENTWANNRDNVVFVTDNKESTLKKNIFLNEDLHIYHSLNVIKVFQLWLSEYSEYDWFMMIDDDAYLFVDRLKSFLSFFNKDDPYMIGDFLNWIDHNTQFSYDYNAWNSGGPGIVFSKSAIQNYLQLIYTLPVATKFTNHDVWLRNIFLSSEKRDIKRVHCPGFYQYGEDKLIKKYSKDSNELISIHLNGKMDYLNKYHEL